MQKFILQSSIANASLGRLRKTSKILFPVFGIIATPTSVAFPSGLRVSPFSLWRLLLTSPVVRDVWTIKDGNLNIEIMLKTKLGQGSNSLN